MRFEVMDDAMADILRQKTPAERLQIAFGMWRFALDMVQAAVRADHPDWLEDRVEAEIAKRMSHGAV